MLEVGAWLSGCRRTRQQHRKDGDHPDNGSPPELLDHHALLRFACSIFSWSSGGSRASQRMTVMRLGNAYRLRSKKVALLPRSPAGQEAHRVDEEMGDHVRDEISAPEIE